MASVLQHPAIERVRAALAESIGRAEIFELAETARTAQDAAAALGIDVGQVASSVVFGIPGNPDSTPLLVITSGRHRVDTNLVSEFLGVKELLRADAEFVRKWSGFAIGGVSPLAWTTTGVRIIIDVALSEYDVIWAAAGHPHAVFQTTYNQLVEITGATPLVVGN